jgi:predicted nuclease of predicted toxin-antitoxin system
VKILLDENLSPRAALALCDDGMDVIHTRDRGLSGKSDAYVLDFAFGEDRVLITANVEDFRKLATRRELHSGIVLLLTDCNTHEQIALFRKAMPQLNAVDWPNTVVTLDECGTVETP